MWGAIKKAINSNLSKPLDRLIEERVSSLDSRILRLQSEMDKCSKKYPVFRDTGFLHVYQNDAEKNFRYSGYSGEIMALILRESTIYDLSKIEFKLDGVKIQLDEISHQVNGDFSRNPYDSPKLIQLFLPLEFKNSIEIRLPSYQTDSGYKYARCFFKTEK